MPGLGKSGSESGRSGSVAAAGRRRASQRCSRANSAGTSTSVLTVPAARPPTTARPSGAFWAPAAPAPSAIGNMPISMAVAVIRTGRKRPAPACSAASAGATPAAALARRLTTVMLLAVAMPMHMMAPVKAGTLMVVWVANSIQAMPASAPGSPPRMTGVEPDWKLTTISR